MPPYREILLHKFTEEYQKLNPEQRRAVDTIDGPVMVIAGPGTGKTQILAARIGKILLDTDALPENILCLTYTDAGTIAMRRRLQQFIGADAYKVNIYTFHAFCNDVIQDNLAVFEKTSLDPVSELESIELFKKLIDDFPKNNPLKRYRGDVYFEINNLRNLFSTMKREGWTPEFLNGKIDEYISSLPLRDEFIAKRAVGNFKKGDIRTDKIEEETDKMEKLRAAVKEFDRFRTLMQKKNRYDFDDMINWVILVFQTHKNILANYQEKFQYVLVDEFQDTSGTQNKLIQLLSSYWEKPNLFVVGDDDQSIFRFQGANVENMLEFASTYQQYLSTIVLTGNYRSTQPILDIAKALIGGNNERLVKQLPGLSKELVAAHITAGTPSMRPLLHEYHSVREEMADITNRVAALLQNNIAPGRIAVIYKENRYGEELARYFRLQDIPVYSKRSINILVHPFTGKLIRIFRYLNAEHDTPYGGDEMLFTILHYDFFKIPPIEIAKITVEANQGRYKEDPSSIRSILAARAAARGKDLFDTGLHDGLKRISAVIEQLIADVPNITLQQLFEQIIVRSGVLNYIMKNEEKLLLMQLLTALFDFIKEETTRNPRLGLNELVNMLDLMEKEGIPLSMTQVAGTEKGVNLLTAHGSKGLEFEYVFLPGLIAGNWEKKKKPGGGYKLPDNLFTTIAAQSDNTSEEELRRLFYVAITRAEKFLYLSYTRYRNDGKETEPSMFIAEIAGLEQLPVEKIILNAEDQFAFDALQFTGKAPQIEKTEEDFISILLDKFVLSVTALNNYLKCPLQFYYQNLIRIPSGKSENLEFGSAVHYALEKLFRKMAEGSPTGQGRKELFPPASELVADFNWYMHRHRGNFTQEAFARRTEYGDEVLRNYYNKYVNTWNKVVAVERNIRGVTINGVPLKGKLDKLEFNGKEINVVDYKTGNIEYALAKMKGPDEKQPLGGDYWRQAVFYKILVDNYEQKDWKVISTEFDFVEPDKKNEYQKKKIIITPSDIETVKQQLTEVWEKIRARDFYTGCGENDCTWCNFVKDNGLAIALHDAAEEE